MAWFWAVVEALAMACVIAGGFMLAGPVALVAGGVLVLVLSFVVNRKAGGDS